MRERGTVLSQRWSEESVFPHLSELELQARKGINMRQAKHSQIALLLPSFSKPTFLSIN